MPQIEPSQESLRHIEQIRDRIHHHNYRYYVLDQPEISDKEFDDLMKELQSLESRSPSLITPDSPTQRVGGKVQSEFESVQHSKQMLSLENVYSETEFMEWWKRVQKGLREGEKIEVTIEPKMDGISLSLIYLQGTLQSAATRGDGVTGEDVTANARTIRSIPLKLLPDASFERFECRGEVYMHKKDFERLNSQALQSDSKTFANPRNAAAGSLRQKDPAVTASRPLKFTVHSHSVLPEKLHNGTHAAFIRQCKDFHLPVPSDPIQTATKPEEVLAYYNQWLNGRSSLPYEIDGVVVKINSFSQQRRLGETNKSPRWAVAFKFTAFQAQSTIMDVQFSVGRTGAVTPVAKIEPVECGGVVISSVSLHNFDEIKRLGVRIQDTVLIERAGDVIPKMIRVLRSPGINRKANRILPPKKCPSCKGEIKKEKETEVAYYCMNLSCPAQLERSLIHFAGRSGLDIEGMGKAVVRELIEKGLVRDFADIYHLKKEDLLTCDLFADKKAENLLNQIELSKTRPLSRLITALGIRHVGEKAAWILSQKYGSLDNLMKASMDDLTSVPETGPVIAESLTHFFSQPASLVLIEKIKKAGVRLKEDIKTVRESPVTNKKFVFTGELSSLSRPQAEEIVRNLGGNPVSNVSKKTDYVVSGSNPGSKFERAKKLGIKILNEEQFKKLTESPVQA